MQPERIIRKFDFLGRISVPKEMRNSIMGTPYVEGMSVELLIENDTIVLKKYAEGKPSAMKKMQ